MKSQYVTLLIFKIIIAIAYSSFACMETPLTLEKKLSHGGRSGLHGMVLFGHGTYFIEHIPMLNPPHDFQAIASVTLKDSHGKIISPNFSDGTYTLKPTKNFSLNDFLNGDLKNFQAEVFLGSFEHDGKILSRYGIITIEVNNLEIVRQLPNPSIKKTITLQDAMGNTYESHIITPEQNIQTIYNQSLSKKLWCALGPDFFDLCII